VPNEAAILIGGRLTEGVGGMVEWGGPLLGAKMSFSKDMGNGITVGTTLFTTDALGAGYGYDGSNTGAVRNQRPSERSSRPTLGNNSNLELAGAATGLAFYASNPNWFANISLYAPDSNEAGITEMDAGTKLSHYARGMVFLNQGVWEIGLGAGLYSGSTTATTVVGWARFFVPTFLLGARGHKRRAHPTTTSVGSPLGEQASHVRLKAYLQKT
jgi:hypothetical protein